jgi:hypothetical protein
MCAIVLAAQVGLNLDDPVHLCALLQFKSTKLGWDLIRVMTAVDRARIASTTRAHMMLLHPDEMSIKLGRLESDEILQRREATLHILQECIALTNATIDALDDRCDNALIEHTAPPYHALMATIEADFDASLLHEMNNMTPLLYWLDMRQDVDELCAEILDGSTITSREARAIALVHGAEIANPNAQIQDQ